MSGVLPFRGTERYEVRRKLGQGGMGVVYEAWDRERDQAVALKTLSSVEPTGIYRLKKEFRALTGLSHPNLVTLHELVHHDGEWFFAMDLVEGVDFIRYVRSDVSGEQRAATLTGSGSGSIEWCLDDTVPQLESHTATALDVKRLRAILMQLASCLRVVHDAGKLHRDLKPSNVLVGEDGHVTVLDFGLARGLGAEQTYASLESTIVGTPAYMAPEQASGENITTATDWYAVGVMLYEALTGVVPFGGSIVQLLTSKQTTEPTHPQELVRDLPTDLSSLCAALLRRDPNQRPTGDEVVRRLVRSDRHSSMPPWPGSRHRLVGRADELDALTAAYAHTRRTGSCLVEVRGDPGAGRSALIRNFLSELRGEAVVLTGRCHERETVPYKALDEVVDALARFLQHLDPATAAQFIPRHVDALARIFPVLERVVAIRRAVTEVDGAGADTPADLHDFRRRAFGALRELLTGIARQSPLVLAIDDLHWGDVDSAALLSELLRRPDPPRLLLAVTYRRADLKSSPLLQRMQSPQWHESLDVAHSVIEVGPLTQDEAQRLATDLLQAQGGRALAERVAKESEGNPLLVTELARHVISHGLEGELRLDAVLAHRVDGLPPNQRALLETLAIAGGPLPARVAIHAADIKQHSARALVALSSANAVRSGWSRGESVIDVYHERMRAVVERSLTPEQLAARHAELAAALEELGGDEELVARHLERSGQRDKGSVFLLRAARTAYEALAFNRAARLLQSGLAMLREDHRDRAALTEALGDALASAGRSVEAAQAYQAAAVAAEAIPKGGGTRRSAFDLQRIAAEHLLRSGHIEQGLAAMKSVLKAVGISMSATPRRALVSVFYHRALLRLRGLKLQRDRTVSEQQRQAMDACWSVSVGLSMVDAIAGADFHARHLLRALKAGDPARLARALALEAAHVGSAGADKHEHALALLEQSEVLSKELGDPHAVGIAKLMRGGNCLFMARWREAVRLTDKAVAIFRSRCVNVAWEIATAQRFNLVALYYLGELAELARRVPADLAAARARGDWFAESCVRSGSSVVAWLAAGDVVGALRQLDGEQQHWGDERFALQHYLALQGYLYVDLYEGRGRDAQQRLENAWAKMERSLLLRIQLLRITMLALRGRAAVVCGDEASLVEAERDATRLQRETPASAHALSLIIRAGVAACRGDAQAAVVLYREATSQFESLEMKLLAAASRYRVAQLAAGDDRTTSKRAADAYFDAQGIRHPERLIDMLAPIGSS